MLVGFSYSRCVKDIVNGVIDIDSVLVVISRTNFDPHDNKEWDTVWRVYRYGENPEWYDCKDEDEDRFRSVSIELIETGKLHQPRQFGAHPIRRHETWLELVLPNSELVKNPAAKAAWEQFQIIAELTNVKLYRSNY
jgi:hypothetical protein